MRRPSVKTKCVADTYHAPNERVVEFSSGSGGGLIAFREVDGILHVTVYQQDSTVSVTVGTPRETAR
jgi:hypothetical protein